jgi:hypothetical protein
LLESYIGYLLVTLVVELGILWLICPAANRRDTLLVALAANLFTHPLATLSMAWPDPVLGFWSAEALVVLVEALAFRIAAGLRFGRATRLSLVANGATILCALLVHPELAFGAVEQVAP